MRSTTQQINMENITKKKVLNIYEKLLDAQQEIGAITKSKDNPFFKSRYADINVILAEVKPILNKNGLLLTQALVTRPDTGKSGIETSIIDRDWGDNKVSGIETSIIDVESEKGLHYFVELPQGATPQQVGSAVTYFRRYALQSLLALEAQDDDANLASGKEVKTGDDANVASGKEVKTGKDSEPVKKFMKDLTGEDNDI